MQRDQRHDKIFVQQEPVWFLSTEFMIGDQSQRCLNARQRIDAHPKVNNDKIGNRERSTVLRSTLLFMSLSPVIVLPRHAPKSTWTRARTHKIANLLQRASSKGKSWLPAPEPLCLHPGFVSCGAHTPPQVLNSGESQKNNRQWHPAADPPADVRGDSRRTAPTWRPRWHPRKSIAKLGDRNTKESEATHQDDRRRHAAQVRKRGGRGAGAPSKSTWDGRA